jgi:hypothetical protein
MSADNALVAFYDIHEMKERGDILLFSHGHHTRRVYLTDSVRKAFQLTFASGGEQIFRGSAEAPIVRDLNFHEFWR